MVATMESAAAQEHERCAQTSLTAAYLDGELEGVVFKGFESHLKECRDCAAALSEQRRLLCLLDAAFNQTFEKKFEPPKDFTRVVRARAQTDMSGVRSRSERALALKICLGLGALAFVLLGATLFREALAPLLAALRGAGSVAVMVGHAAADAGTGGTVVLRAVGAQLIAGQSLFRILQWMFFASAVALLLRLISRYHRASAGD
ncbi:MAG: hypothetical protein LC754_09765 [Acidobacteria bacterium]|nr:hypothetical protein [Acidobacteriota bacterium]